MSTPRKDARSRRSNSVLLNGRSLRTRRSTLQPSSGPRGSSSLGRIRPVLLPHQPSERPLGAQFRMTRSDSSKPDLAHRLAQLPRDTKPCRTIHAIHDGVVGGPCLGSRGQGRGDMAAIQLGEAPAPVTGLLAGSHGRGQAAVSHGRSYPVGPGRGRVFRMLSSAGRSRIRPTPHSGPEPRSPA
jgi:hypothetical protein